MTRAVEEVADAKERFDGKTQICDEAALELVRAQTACAKTEEARRAKLDAARGRAPKGPAPVPDVAARASPSVVCGEETQRPMAEWKAGVDARVKVSSGLRPIPPPCPGPSWPDFGPSGARKSHATSRATARGNRDKPRRIWQFGVRALKRLLRSED